MRSGRCECEAVSYRSEGPWRNILACHCSQCRRISGHFWAATAVAETALTIEGEEALTWFRSSSTARRGFCRRCGSSLFYQRDGSGYVAIGAGTLDDDSGLAMIGEVFVADKGGYYALSPDVPHHEAWSSGADLEP